MPLIKELQHSINKSLEYIELPKYPKRIHEPMRYFIDLGGKRIRPILTLLAAEIYDVPKDQSMFAALAIELFHNFTLLHDDLMDASSLRRGQATVHKKWNSSVAILSGDAMLISAYQVLSESESASLPELLKAFNRTAMEVCQGQQLDMDYEEEQSLTIDEYINMIRLKTAVLLGLALRFGGVIGNASEEDKSKLESFGVNIGIAFQLQDDLLDVYGNTQHFGKEIGKDILANKKTFLMLHALKMAKNDNLKQLNYWLSTNDNPKEKVDAITNIYNQLNIHELTIKEMNKYSEKAYESLSELSVPEEKTQTLKKLAEGLLTRKN